MATARKRATSPTRDKIIRKRKPNKPSNPTPVKGLRTELREALEQQTATSDILRAISSSPTDSQPVFDTIVRNARRLCGAHFGVLHRFDGEKLHLAAHDVTPEVLAVLRRAYPMRPNRSQASGRAILTRAVAEIPDVREDPDYRHDMAIAGEWRSLLAVPMLRANGDPLGTIVVQRSEPGSFPAGHIEMLKTFADQAVIAIENVRLFNEQREALEQQTATADILRVISQSPTDVQPVLNVVAEAAQRFCGAEDVTIGLREGDSRIAAAHLGPMQAGVGEPFPVSRQSVMGRSIISAETVQVSDIDTVSESEFATAVQLARRFGWRAAAAAPLMREGGAAGAILLRRPEAGAFTPRQIELLETFAAQAVIAIENVRLFTETREALERQTATSQVLQVINSSPGDLAPVFDAMLEKAMRLCGAAFGTLWIFDGEFVHAAAIRGASPAYAEFLTSTPHRPGVNNAHGRLLRGEEFVHIADVAAETADRLEDPMRRATIELGGTRTLLAVPLRKGSAVLGFFVIYRREVRLFGEKQISLLQNFAAQAVIAIENARLITETREALEQQTATAEVLQVINSSPGDLGPVFDMLLEKAMQLCGAAFGHLDTYDGTAFHTVAIRGAPAQFAEYRNLHSSNYGPGTGPARMLAGAGILYHHDLKDEDIYRDGEPNRRALVDLGGARSALQVALRKDDALLGFLILFRQEVRPFTDRQGELLQNFAAQAVIAMENARLLTEQREALEQQTATAEVLQVINSSPGDLAPAFDAMLEKATSLCEAAFGILWTYDGERYHAAAFRNVPRAYAEYLREPPPASPETPLGRIAAGESLAQIPDIAVDRIFGLSPLIRHAVELGGFRTVLGVALRKEGTLLGAITVYRQEVRLFSDKQVTLLQNFAAQAVIAMENARLLTETREALEQQTATTEVLETINSSPGDLKPVFEVMLAKAMTLCEAAFGTLNTFDGQRLTTAATRGVPEAFARYRLSNPPEYGPGTGPARLVAGEDIVHEIDAADSEAYRQGDSRRRAIVELGGARTILNVALRKDDVLLGTLSIYRQEVRLFSDKQIKLLQNFAAQAVVAMENARLLGELRQRTDELIESLKYQTATSNVLKVISSSTFVLQKVLDTLVESAVVLCEADIGTIRRREGEVYMLAATFGFTQEARSRTEGYSPLPSRSSIFGQAVLEGRTIHIPDILADPDYARPDLQRLTGFRAALGVLLRREGNLIGTLVLQRFAPGPFTPRQIELVETFADQAVIAMENARLLGELTRREEELRVTFDHMGDGVVMFDAELKLASWNRNFQELLDVPDSFLASRPGLEDYVRLLVQRGELGDRDPDKEVARYRDRATRQWSTERTRPDGRVLEVRNNPVPGGGAVLIYSDITARKQAEAEIAAARDAAEAALERQTATADILRVIASSPSDVQPVFDAIAERSNHLIGGLSTAVFRLADDVVHLMSFTSVSPEADAALKALYPIPLSRSPQFRETVRTCEVYQLSDAELELRDNPDALAVARLRGYRSRVLVPLIQDGQPIGIIGVTRAEPGSIADEHVELLKTFAAQAVIAIENVRLFTELRDSLERLKAAQANLIQSEKMASLGQLTAGIAHEIKNPLNFVNNFAGLSSELLDELKQAVDVLLAEPDENKRAELQETMDLLTSNLAKIVEHGRRADGIVKSMLSHSRGGKGDWQESNINALVEEALNLAYHGARAQDNEFNVTLERDFDPESKPIELVPQDVTRVFLNLFGNGFYASNKRRLGNVAGYRPSLKVSTRDLGDAVEIRVRDNGTGIPPEVRDKLFQPFFTTKPTGEGTGLGLSISYDIVSQQHGGSIEVESEPGAFTEFTVRLPRRRRAA